MDTRATIRLMKAIENMPDPDKMGALMEKADAGTSHFFFSVEDMRLWLLSKGREYRESLDGPQYEVMLLNAGYDAELRCEVR